MCIERHFPALLVLRPRPFFERYERNSRRLLSPFILLPSWKNASIPNRGQGRVRLEDEEERWAKVSTQRKFENQLRLGVNQVSEVRNCDLPDSLQNLG